MATPRPCGPSRPRAGARAESITSEGINIALPEGTPVKAAEDGVVTYAGGEVKGYGNLVLVRDLLVLSIDPAARRMSFSLKQAGPDPCCVRGMHSSTGSSTGSYARRLAVGVATRSPVALPSAKGWDTSTEGSV